MVNNNTFMRLRKRMWSVIGSAGTGKTFVAVCDGCSEALKKAKKKIILTRPAVEAGENLGFLPGDLKEKWIHIYVRYTMLLYRIRYGAHKSSSRARRYRSGTASVYAWAYIRRSSFIILDEAQNN